MKLIYTGGILLSLLAFDGPRHFVFQAFEHPRGGARLEPGRAAQPARKRPRDLTVPRQFRGYNGPRDA